jgi:TetR/AcrR family tetracycline transcriptional repressor
MRKRRPDAKPRPRLDLDLIVKTAIDLLDDVGLDGLTTRALATRLGVQSAALYWYVQDKNELLDLVADAMCKPMLATLTQTPADPSPGWRQQLEAGMRAYREILHSHRDAPRLFAERPPIGPARQQLADGAVGLILQAGFSDKEAALVSILLSDYVTSIVSDEIRLQSIGEQPAPIGATEHPDAESPSTKYPNLARIGPHFAALRPGELFDAGLSVFLDGIERRLSRTR